MRKPAASKRYTVRGQKRSFNRVIVEELTGTAIGARRRPDLSNVTGGLVPDPAFDEIVVSQRQIDSEKWK